MPNSVYPYYPTETTTSSTPTSDTPETPPYTTDYTVPEYKTPYRPGIPTRRPPEVPPISITSHRLIKSSTPIVTGKRLDSYLSFRA